MGLRPIWLVGLLSVAGPLAGITAGDVAQASVSIAVTWDGLLRDSSLAAVATPLEARSAWENGRIYTYTRVRVDRAVAGDAAQGSSLWVRTMGGVVDKIGQIVEGEAVFVPGEPSLLFLRPGPPGALHVTERGQGQFPILAGDALKPPRVMRSNAVGAIVPPQGLSSSPATRLAADLMHGRAVDDVVHDVAADWGRTHAR
jgi:hypothetical protein